MGKKKNKKEHCHCLSSFGRFCFFIGKSQQCSKQLHEYTDCFWQLPINKDWAGSIPTWPSPWEFLVLYKPFFITENTHASPHSSGWLLLREGARCGMGSAEGWLCAPLCPAPGHPRRTIKHVPGPCSDSRCARTPASGTGKDTMNPARTPPAHSQAFLMLLLGWHVHGGA